MTRPSIYPPKFLNKYRVHILGLDMSITELQISESPHSLHTGPSVQLISGVPLGLSASERPTGGNALI